MNRTAINEIILLGFQNLQDFKYLMFFCFLVIYLATLTSNVLIILLVSISDRLQSPMYFFLGNLSFSDMLLTSNIVPSMLQVMLLERSAISLTGCITQCFFLGALLAIECFLLTVMSYDRYVAICKPLHYATIMDLKLCVCLGGLSWTLGITMALITILLQTLWICGSNIIDNFFCDLISLLEICCSDVSIVKFELFTASILLTVLPLMLITVTYVYILLTILRITSVTGRQKTFSTCSSHLAVVGTYYGALFAMYVVPSKGSVNMNKVVSLIYTVITPLFNPIIYSLRNQKIKSVIWRYLSGRHGG